MNTITDTVNQCIKHCQKCEKPDKRINDDDDDENDKGDNELPRRNHLQSRRSVCEFIPLQTFQRIVCFCFVLNSYCFFCCFSGNAVITISASYDQVSGRNVWKVQCAKKTGKICRRYQ